MVEGSTEVVIVILSIVLVFAIISACCRGLSRAYRRHLLAEEMAQRRQTFYLDPNNAIPNPDSTQRAVRVTTISREGDTIAMGVYEIHVPRNHNRPGLGGRSRTPRLPVIEVPPPSFNVAYQVSSPVHRGHTDLEEPPPSYDEYIKSQPICDSKEDQHKKTESCQERY